MKTPDYNYNNSPEFINMLIDQMGGMSQLLTFCQVHHVYVEPTSDLQYGCVIGDEKPFTGYYGIDLDCFSALVLGVLRFKKIEFINQHFPPDVVRNLHKSGFFSKSKMSMEDIEKRVCKFFNLESIFDYAKIGEGAGVHLTLTKQAIKQERDNLTKLTDL